MIMRFPVLSLLLCASVTTVFAAPQTTAPAPRADQQAASANGVDSIIALVQANMSEALVLKTIQRQNKAYDLTPDDLLKLQKAGVSERIINAMLDPSTASSANPAPAAVPPPAAAPSAAPAAPRAASGPAGSNLAASGPAGPEAASKGAPGTTNAAAGCSQTSSTAAPAPGQQQPKGGVFSSFKDRLKGSAQKTVDGFGDTVNCAVDKGVQTSESQVSSAADNAAATPAQKVSDATSAATKPVTTATTNATNSVSTAQTSAKSSVSTAQTPAKKNATK
jgi:hypothetical protein